MGKDTGFLEYGRKENEWEDVNERIKSFAEFKLPLDEKTRKEQAARCMNCGVPMCQSALKLGGMVTGCPLHNFIPEWNEALFLGQFDMAAWRLLKTSSFPEFTGRVCPALCEKACNCGNPSQIAAGSSPVTIHDNELFIIEKAFESGYMKPQIPPVRSGKKIAVIGSGPAGLAVADLLNRRGHSVIVFEREDRIGGLLTYGIPNMKLNKKIVDRRVNLMKAEGVEFVTGANIGEFSATDQAVVTNANSKYTPKELLKNYDAIALCCGAKAERKLNVPKEDANGIYFAVDFLKSVTKALLDNSEFGSEKAGKLKDMPEVAGKNIIIVGGGDTGNDCTGTCVRLGAKSVTALEMMPAPPVQQGANNPWPQWPKILKTDYGQQEVIATEGHDPRIFKTVIKEIHTDDSRQLKKITTIQVEFRNIDGKNILCQIEGSEQELPADMILIAAGFTGCEAYTPKAFGVELSKGNTVATAAGPESYTTNVPKVFTAGDMHRGQSLVVWAIAEGRDCAREIDQYLMGYSNI